MMATGPGIEDMGGPIARLFGEGSASGMDEGELLRRFALDRDPVALEVLVARHGPMVLGVCRRVLGNRHSSEDAFQATFLVLARRAGSIRDPDRLGPWLHGVAHRVAVRARADLAKRNARERPGAEDLAMETSADESGFDRLELRAALDEEVRRLPEKFRDPIVLCYLDGLTHDEAATRLRCPVGTVRSRLSTGRTRLRERLARRGVTVPSGVFAAVLTGEAASAAVTPVLLSSTVKAATAFAAGMAGATAAGMVSAEVASLAEGVAKTMILSKFKAIGGLALAGMLTVGVGGVAAYQAGGPGQDAKVEKVEKPADESPEVVIAKLRRQLAQSEDEALGYKSDLDSAKAELKAAKAMLYPARSKEAIAQANEAAARQTAANYPVGDSQAGRGIGGFGRAIGTPASVGGSKSFTTLQMQDFVVVYKPKSNKVPTYSMETGSWTTYEAPKGMEVVPCGGPGILAVKVIGDEIGEIAAFASPVGRWFPIKLKEPAKGEATPTLGPGVAVYPIGRRVYAFSVTTRSWDVLELPEGAKPIPTIQPNRVTVELNDHLYIFSLKSGKWADFDAKASGMTTPEAK